MAEDNPTEEMIRREVAEAARILREDGYAATQQAIKAKLDKHFPDEPDPDKKDGDTGDGNPSPPDKKDPPNPSGEKKRGLWWGDAVSE